MSDLVLDGWSITNVERALDRVIDYRGKSPPKSDSGVPLITAKNIRKGFINVEPREYIPTNKFDSWMIKGLPQRGDIFITTEAPLGNVARVPSYLFAIGQRVLTLRTKKEILCSEFLLHVMQGDDFKDQLDLQSTGSTVAGIKQSTFRKMSLILPPLPEQQKIAAILTSVDEVIEKTQAQVDKLKDLKTGMMQSLLTNGVGIDGKPHTEFKDSPVGRIPKGWEVVKFKDIFQSYKYGPRFSSKGYAPSGNVKTIRGTDLSSNGVIKYRQVPVARLDSKLVEQNVLQNGDLVMITTADCGATAVFESQSIPFIASAYAIKLTPKQGLNSKYINYFMQTDDASSQVESFIRKGTVANLPGSDVMSITLALPSINEQDKVVQILEQLDSNISLKLESLESNRRIKKALMQDLLTGKVRVSIEGK